MSSCDGITPRAHFEKHHDGSIWLCDSLRFAVPWIQLIVAGVFEWGWPIGLKLGLADTGLRWSWIAFAVVCMGCSGALLLLAQRDIPMGTAYAVWTGIGAVGTLILGILLFGEPATLGRFFFVGLIVIGILGLKFST